MLWFMQAEVLAGNALAGVCNGPPSSDPSVGTASGDVTVTAGLSLGAAGYDCTGAVGSSSLAS